MVTGRNGTLVAVVVTYNRLEKLTATVARLLGTDPGDLARVVVVDNASTDGTGAWLAAQTDPRLTVLTSEANIGGAGGFERGMRHAVEAFDPDWIVVMDDDASPSDGAISAFQSLNTEGYEAVAAAVYYPSGEICEMNRPSRNPFWHWTEFRRTLMTVGGRGGFHIRPSDYAGEGRDIDVASFVGLFVSRAGIARVGYPDGRLFVYGEDGIYTLGLTRAGGRIRFAPQVAFEHDCSTFAGQRGRFRPLWKVYYYHRNLLLLYRMAAGWLFWPALLVVLPKWLLKVRDHKGERRAFLRLLGRAVRDGLLRRTGTGHTRILTLSGVKRPRSEPHSGVSRAKHL